MEKMNDAFYDRGKNISMIHWCWRNPAEKLSWTLPATYADFKECQPERSWGHPSVLTQIHLNSVNQTLKAVQYHLPTVTWYKMM